MSAEQYVEKRRYGGLGKPGVEDSDSDPDPDLGTKTPNTRKYIKEEKLKKEIPKLSNFMTFMTLFKGFIISSPIYTPKSFVNGGWLMSSIMQVVSAIFTLYCASLLLELKEKTGLVCYSKIGYHTFGFVGKLMTEITLWVTQVGFCCAYTFFIKENIHSILFEMSKGKIDINPNIIAVGCWVMFTLLCLVRKIEKFAVTHIFADVMIFVTCLIVIVYGIINLKDEGNRIDTIYAINPETWSASIGFSVFSYEGIGTVLPIYEITKNPHLFRKIIVLTIAFACSIFLVFGNFCCCAWGDELKTPLITDQIKNGDSPNYVGWLVRIMFMINLMFSYPLILYPALMINENYLFDGWEKTKKRQWGKNLNRALTCLFITVVTILLK